MKLSIRTRLTVIIAGVSLLAVLMISILANFFIEEQFKNYVSRQQQSRIGEIVSDLGSEYDSTTGQWDAEGVHSVGMSALYDGYIIKLYNAQGLNVWDAEASNMDDCLQVMGEVTDRMQVYYPQLNGEYTSQEYPVTLGDKTVGQVKIRYFGPFFFSEADFAFMKSMNTVLLLVGALSLLLSAAAGIMVSRHFSRPVLRAAEVAEQIADGDYDIRINEGSNTKELHTLITAVNRLAQSLEKQENLRKQLTADVAHELRTPLTTLQTHIEAMAEGIWEPSRERLQNNLSEVIRLSKLVKDLEGLARAESGSLQLEKSPVSLRNLCTLAAAGFENEIKEKQLQVTLSGSGEIQADRDRISQVFINLLSNAIKYSKSGGMIEISIAENEKEVSVSVRDNGIGIPQGELPYIFERFYRADKSRNRHTGGAGIGLAIVKSIAAAHGGSVEVQSELDKGSIFTVRLPKN